LPWIRIVAGRAVLELKKSTSGTDEEIKRYPTLKLSTFVDRFMTKRPVRFAGVHDDFTLREGGMKRVKWADVPNSGITKSYKKFGSDLFPKLEEYMSYDEMTLSALCGVSSPTHFINSGSKSNKGEKRHSDQEYERKGIFISLVGPRFERPGVMKHRFMVIDRYQNTKKNGHGDPESLAEEDIPLIGTLHEYFYQVPYFPTWDQHVKIMEEFLKQKEASTQPLDKEKHFANLMEKVKAQYDISSAAGRLPENDYLSPRDG